MVVVPVEPAQVVVEEDWMRVAVTVGMARMATVASATDAVAVDRAGKVTVVTLAHSAWALTAPLSAATHGVDVVDDDVVETKPVSGVGGQGEQGDSEQGRTGGQAVGPPGQRLRGDEHGFAAAR